MSDSKREKNFVLRVLDSEDPPREAPAGMKEKINEYNRLQTEDPAKAQAMLAEFMADEAVVAGLAKPVEFGEEQVAFVSVQVVYSFGHLSSCSRA